jgi:hypothetical protein
MQENNNAYDLSALLASTRALETECIRTRKMLSYCRRRKSRGLPIEESQMAEDIGREMKPYCEQEREQETPVSEANVPDYFVTDNTEPPDSVYWLEYERETYAEYLETLREELLEFEVQ